MLLDKTLQSQLGQQESPMRVNEGEARGHFHRLADFKSGVFHLSDLRVAVADLSPMNRHFAHDASGIVGYPTFEELLLTFDFDQQRLVVSVPPKIPQAGMNELPLMKDPESKLLVVDLPVNGVSERFVIDTGDTGTIRFGKAAFDRWVAAGLINPKDLQGLVVGVGGTNKMQGGELNGVTLLGVDCHGMKISTDDRASPRNLLGLEFLRKFVFSMDLKNQVFFYRKRERISAPLNPVRLLGAIFAYESGITTVEILAPTPGPLEKAGVKKGDQILRLGALKGSEMSMNSVYELCQKHPGGPLEVEYKREGKVYQIEIQVKKEGAASP